MLHQRSNAKTSLAVLKGKRGTLESNLNIFRQVQFFCIFLRGGKYTCSMHNPKEHRSFKKPEVGPHRMLRSLVIDASFRAGTGVGLECFFFYLYFLKILNKETWGQVVGCHRKRRRQRLWISLLVFDDEPTWSHSLYTWCFVVGSICIATFQLLYYE